MSASACPPSPYEILVETPAHGPAVEALYDEVFGPGRFAKTAERLREGNAPIPGACLVAVDAGGLTGAVRLWPIAVGEGGRAAWLGPLAVAERRRGNGVAFRLMEQAIAVCAAAGHDAVLLVGDEPYYARAGFVRAAPGRFAPPGPVDPRRLLIRPLGPGADALAGPLSVPRAATPAS